MLCLGSICYITIDNEHSYKVAKLEFKLRAKLTPKTIFFPRYCKVIPNITEHCQCAGHHVRHWGAQAQFLRRKELGFELGLASNEGGSYAKHVRSVSMDTEKRTSLAYDE